MLYVRCNQVVGFKINLAESFLDVINLLCFEVWLTALSAYPRWNRVPRNVVSIAVGAKGCNPFLHFSFTVQAFHQDFLVLKFSSH
jgi:hypothetical protein